MMDGSLALVQDDVVPASPARPDHAAWAHHPDEPDRSGTRGLAQSRSTGGCCGAGAAGLGDVAALGATPPEVGDTASASMDAYVQEVGDGRHTLHLMVEGIHCGGCVAKIERAARGHPEVEQARVNMTTRRLALVWAGPPARGTALAQTVRALGYEVAPYDPQRLTSADEREERALLRAMAVAGFASANIMLLSVSVWAGHAQGMADTTRDLMHWFSALIALPAIVYAGRPFFRSALSALKAGMMNMDVPISLAVILASAVSLHETMRSGPHAYFDSAVMLLFFLLIGRFLDRRARGRARSAAERLLSLRANSVTVIQPDGSHRAMPPDAVAPGMQVQVAAGERIGIDGVIARGRSDIDTSVISGETTPKAVGPGEAVFAGTINQSGPLVLTVTATGEDTLLGEIVRLMEAAETRKGRFVALADRLSRAYAPVVHGLALAAFLGWILLGGMVWQEALMIAIAVLIITCPCALGLAIPAVQVIASGRLMRAGILLKSGTALERLRAVDTVVFDKTGTLTLGRPELQNAAAVCPHVLRAAAGVAANSRHPLARALVRAVPDVPVTAGVEEVPGCGLRLFTEAGEVRLGRRDWCGVALGEDTPESVTSEGDVPGAPATRSTLATRSAAANAGPEMWFVRPNRAPVRLVFADTLRADAPAVVAELQRQGLRVELLSGDRAPVVTAVAESLGIATRHAGVTPDAKLDHLRRLEDGGARVLMVGDGLNDAPALAAASVSISPASAADISQTAADIVFQGDRLQPVLDALDVARRADRRVRQNLALAFGYNIITVPIALAGLVTPLIAAVAMSGSSIIVVLNALRLARVRS